MSNSDREAGHAASIARIWAYAICVLAIIGVATWVSRLDYAYREYILLSLIYTLVPVCLGLGLLGRFASHVGLMLVVAAFFSGVLYSGDVGGGWSHGVAGGMTVANAMVAGITLFGAGMVRRRFARKRIATLHGG